MSTRKTKESTTRARQSARKNGPTVRRRLDTIGKTVKEGADGFVRWLGKAVESTRAGLANFGKAAVKTATAIAEELRDDVAGVKRRLAAEKPVAPAGKQATTGSAKRPGATRKTTGRRKAPVRRKAAAKKAPARRATARKKPAPRRKAAGAAR